MNEIEDVVSSVRRLVSPEARPRPFSRDLGLEKLILTPALLVVHEPMKAKKATVKPKAKTAAPLRRRPKAESPKPDPIRVEPLAEAEWEAPFWSEADPSLAEMALQAEEAVLVTSPDTVAEPAPAVAKKPTRARKMSARKVAAAPVEKSAKPAPKPRKAVAKPASVVVKAVLELVRSESEATAEVSPFAVELAANMPELVANPPVEAEAASPTAVEEDLVVNGLTQVLTDRDGNPVSLLDEAELIQMVRRVIRDELQDVLGERITRNIRKLVRAEINRVLTSQTLE